MPPDASHPTEPGADAAQPRLLLATTNPHKLAEFRRLLADAPYTLVDPSALGLDLEVPETGATFAENAAIKALAWAGTAGMLTLADDSGLEIDALDGWPGIHSARWIGPEVPYTDRNRIILERMAGVPLAKRTARYRCAIAVADMVVREAGSAPRAIITVEGVVEGYIAQAPCGSGGFGYDPIFEVIEEHLTFGEMSDAEKDRISHRGRAARAAMTELRQAAPLRRSASV